MLVNYIIAFAIIVLIVSFCWILHGITLFPIKNGDNAVITVSLSVNGQCPELEHMLKGLVWLRDNGTLKADIVIDAKNPDLETREVGMAFSADYQFIFYNESGD